MRVKNDVHKCVAFVGIGDDKDEIRVVGTGFFVTYQNHGYLVTAKHVASTTAAYAGLPLDHASFLIRLNQNAGGARNMEVTDVQWVFHPDENVDLAVVPFEPVRLASEFDCRYLPQATLPSKDCDGDVGLGDICYTVDLCRLLRGQKRNLPVLRIGSVALPPERERIPVQDWNDERWLPPRLLEVYLVEFPGLIGMGGSPVFVRTCVESADLRVAGRPVNATIARSDLILLGMLQDSWNLPKGEILSSPGTRPEAPSGMGVVIPAERIIEVLELPALREPRDDADRRRRFDNAAAIGLAVPEKWKFRARDAGHHDG